MMKTLLALPLLLSCTAGCVSAPIPGAIPADDLIEADEVHFSRLWKLTRGGQNAEAYWSFDGDRLVLQRRNPDEGVPADQIYVMNRAHELELVSSGGGATTCSYFLPGDEQVIFASTHGHGMETPPSPDHSEGYVWALHPQFDLWIRDLETDQFSILLPEWGYDAEATVSPLGDRIVFTSTRSGDLELWTCDLDGSHLVQVTNAVGYDGGAFFSHDGKRLVFRTTKFTPGKEAQEQEQYWKLLGEWKIRPHTMDIMVIDVDGSNRRRLTDLGRASFAPFFYPDDSRVIFATNHHDVEKGHEFDLFSIGIDGEELEQITTYVGFDSFPMFSPDGRWLVFASNRGGSQQGETNVFVAEWK